MPAWDIMRPARSVRGGGQRPRSRLRRGRRRCNRESEHRACRRSPSNRVSPGSLAPRTKPAWPLRRLPPRCGNSSDVMNASLPSPMKRVMRWQRSSMWGGGTGGQPSQWRCLKKDPVLDIPLERLFRPDMDLHSEQLLEILNQPGMIQQTPARLPGDQQDRGRYSHWLHHGPRNRTHARYERHAARRAGGSLHDVSHAMCPG